MPTPKNYGKDAEHFQLPKRGSTSSIPAEQLRAVLGGRMAEDFLENAVEVRQRLKADFKSNLADTQVGIEQQIFRFLDPDAGQVIGEIDARHLLKQFAEVKRACVDCFGDLPQRK